MSVDKNEELLKKYRSPDKQVIRRWDRSMTRPTVGQLVLWCVDQGLDLSEVRVTGGEISWEDIETDAERDKRVRHWEAIDHSRATREQRTFDVTMNMTEEQWPTRNRTTA